MSMRQCGMTLIEVTVAAVIFSMIMLATVTAFRTFAGTYTRLEQQTARTMQMREAERFLRETLKNAVNKAEFFTAEQRSVEWVAPLDRVGGVVGLQRMRLRKQKDELAISFAPLGPPDRPPAWDSVAPSFPLVNDLERIRFYYQVNPQDAWSDKIDPEKEASTLPHAIALEIVAQGRQWPPVVVQFDQYRPTL